MEPAVPPGSEWDRINLATGKVALQEGGYSMEDLESKLGSDGARSKCHGADS